MRQGDTVSLLLKYQLNGEDLQKDAYDEIELQINKEGSSKAIKKLLSNGGIKWGTVVEEDGSEFTGYYVDLNQSETFALIAGQSQVQLRVKSKDGQVGSSPESMMSLGTTLSNKVL